MEEKKYGIESKEYRSAFLKNLMGKELTVEERAVIASANVAGAIPTETQNNIFAKVVEKAPMLDEITLLSDFINTAAILSDIYSMIGMKIIMSGTDSLGFIMADSDELYDRNIMLHTSFISFNVVILISVASFQ